MFISIMQTTLIWQVSYITLQCIGIGSRVVRSVEESGRDPRGKDYPMWRKRQLLDHGRRRRTLWTVHGDLLGYSQRWPWWRSMARDLESGLYAALQERSRTTRKSTHCLCRHWYGVRETGLSCTEQGEQLWDGYLWTDLWRLAPDHGQWRHRGKVCVWDYFQIGLSFPSQTICI